MQFKNIFLLLLVFVSLVSSAQVKIGEWRDHLSYNYSNSVTKVGEIVYSSIAHNQSSQAEVDLFVLSDGMYILQVNCEKVSHTQKIMISSR